MLPIKWDHAIGYLSISPGTMSDIGISSSSRSARLTRQVLVTILSSASFDSLAFHSYLNRRIALTTTIVVMIMMAVQSCSP